MSDHLLSGVLVPLVTQMSAPGVPDAELATSHLEVLAASGIHGLMLLGSNGEGPLVQPGATERYVVDVTRRWREFNAAGKVIVNVSAPGTSEALDRARTVLDAEPDAFTMTAPSYFRHRTDEVLRHIDAVASLGTPVVVYHLPRLAGPLGPATLEGLIADPRVIGVKDSSGDLDGLRAIISAAAGRESFAVSQGDEVRLLEGLDRGAAGLLPGIANIAPRLAVDLYSAWSEGRRPEAEHLQALVTALTRIHHVRPGVPTVKRTLTERGYGSPVVSEPLAPVTEEEYVRLCEVLEPLEEHLIIPTANR